MPADLGHYVDDEAVENIGNREPNLEVFSIPDLLLWVKICKLLRRY